MKWLRALAGILALVGVGLLATPSTVFAGTCQADNGASCTCSGDCWASATKCGCGKRPPV